HGIHLAPAVENIHAFFLRNHRISVEVSGTLFKLGEVFNGLQCPLRSEQALNIYPAQRRRVNPMTEFLRPGVTSQMGGPIGVTVGMAVEAGYSPACALGTAVFRGIELLLWESGNQEAQTFQLLWIQNAIEQLIVVVH